MAASSRHPVDKGYAWVVLLSCSITRMLVTGFWPCIGNFYVEWQHRFDASASSIAWIGFAFLLVMYLTGLLASAVCHKFTYKAVTTFAGILTCISLFVLSFVTELWQIYVIIPFCGMGLGIAYQHGFAFYVYYFDKRYAFASTLNAAAAGIALFILPPLIETLNRIYGISGALWITSALMLNISVCGMLSRQPRWEINRTRDRTINESTQTKLKLDDVRTESSTETVSDGGLTPTKRKLDDDKHGKTDIKATQVSDGESKNIFKDITKGIFKSFELSLFLNIRFLFQGIFTPLMYSGAIVVMLYTVPYGVHIGISALKSSFLLSVTGISMLCGRAFPFGLMVDKKILSPSRLGGISCIFGGLTTMAFPFTIEYYQMVLVTVVFGAGVMGIGGSMYPILVRDAAGSSERATCALAYSNLLYGVGGVTGNLFTGFLFDLTQSYTPAYFLAGGYFILMGLSMLCDPYLKRWQAESDERSKEKRRTERKGTQRILLTSQV